MMKLLTLPLAVAFLRAISTTSAATPATPPPPPQPVAADGAWVGVIAGNGTVNASAYKKIAQLWGPQSVNDRLGPTFVSLSPNAADDRPTLYKQPSKSCELSFANRNNPYELGRNGCMPDDDYWSDSGQVAYVPDDPANDPGVDRVQTFAYYNHVFALSPRLDFASGSPHPDPQTRENDYKKLLGHFPQHPVAILRDYGMLQNEALVIYREGLLGVLGTQTSRQGYERPYPGLMLPANKVPTAMAVTSQNEFALITVWDTDTQHGQIAVVAIEAKYLPFHTWPYMGLPNQGSFSDFKLLGYVDLPMAAPTSIAAAGNGFWGGPSQTNNKVLSQIDLTDEGTRAGLDHGDLGWTAIISKNGYALVASKSENKVAILDLTPLFNYIRKSYLSSKESFEATVKNRGNGPAQWPATFEEKPEIKPHVVWESPIPSPTAVLAGIRTDRWSQDRFKGYVASEDGTIHILDTSPLMAQYDWEKKGKLGEIGSFKVGRNPTNMVFSRFGEGGLPLIPNGHDGKPMSSDPLNNTLWIACRGDREVVAVVTFEGQGTVYRRIRDKRMEDPVAVSIGSRGYIVTVADYNGKKIHSFRIGAMVDRHGQYYGAGEDGKSDYEYCGSLTLAGRPFAVTSVNVN